MKNNLSFWLRIEDLTQKLINLKLISYDQHLIALQEQKASSRPLEQIYIDLDFLTAETFKNILKKEFHIPLWSDASFSIDPLILKHFPYEVAKKLKVCPLYIENQTVGISIVDIFDIKAIDAIRGYYPKHLDIQPYVASESEFFSFLEKAYQFDSGDLLVHLLEPSNKSEHKVIEFVDKILKDAIKKRATDIHFEPESVFVRVRYRVDGMLHTILSFHKRHWSYVMGRLKILSGLDVTELRLPQSGRFSSLLLGREVDFRISSHPTIFGESFVLRILDKLNSLLPLDKLGFRSRQMEQIQQILQKPEGLLIITGPTGSGKTTTLYSLLQYLDAQSLNIMTLEDPIEYELPWIRQTQIKEEINLTFAEGIRSILRQDPDVIFIGEIRDETTAQMALRASMTGHLVMTTLHTNSALGAINRLIDLGIRPSLLSGNILAVMAQRLVRLLCRHCRRLDEQQEGFIAVGCSKCHHTGYYGRSSLLEFIPWDSVLDEKIIHASLSELQAHVARQGIESLSDTGFALVQAGETSLDELKRVVRLQKAP